MKSVKNLGDLREDGQLGDVGGGGRANGAFLAALPVAVKRRLCALKKLQMDGIRLEAEFHKRVHDLECEFANLFQSIHDKRRKIVTGVYEPTDEEVDYRLLNGLTDEHQKKQMNGMDSDGGGGLAGGHGVPQFWLTLLKHQAITAEMIQEHDEPVLQHFTDVNVVMISEPAGFKLEFHFEQNDFFSNKILTKEYSIECEPNADDPFEYDGPAIIACKGCKIDWKEGKNVTVRMIEEKQKHMSAGGMHFISKRVGADSFFNFFRPPRNTPDDKANLADNMGRLLVADFAIGQTLRERIVPRAVLYYTGEVIDDSFEEEVERQGGNHGVNGVILNERRDDDFRDGAAAAVAVPGQAVGESNAGGSARQQAPRLGAPHCVTKQNASLFVTPVTSAPGGAVIKAYRNAEVVLPLTMEPVWRPDGDSGTPTRFSIRLRGWMNEMIQVARDINAPTRQLTNPSIGMAAIASHGHRDWYRAEVTAVDGDTVTVRDVDWGTYEQKKPGEVFEVNDEQPMCVRATPKLTIDCTLAGIVPIDGDAWSVEALHYFRTSIDCARISEVTINKQQRDGIYEVEALTVGVFGGRSVVADEMVKKSLAKYVH